MMDISRQRNGLEAGFVPIECKADSGDGGRRHPYRRRRAVTFPEMDGQLVADIKVYQVGIYRGIDDIQSPKKQKEKDGIVLVLPGFIAVLPKGIVLLRGYRLLESGLDLVETVNIEDSCRLIADADGEGILRILIRFLVVKIKISRYSYGAPGDRYFPVLAVIELTHAGKYGRIKRRFPGIVLFPRCGVYFVGRILAGPRGLGARRQCVRHPGARALLAFNKGRDRIIFLLTPAKLMTGQKDENRQ